MWKRLSLWFVENLVVFSWCHLQGWHAWDVCLQSEKERSKEFKSWLTDEQSSDFIVWYCLFFVAKKVGLMCKYLGSSVQGTQLTTITSRALSLSIGHWALTARSVSWSKWGSIDQYMKGDWLYWLLDLTLYSATEWLCILFRWAPLNHYFVLSMRDIGLSLLVRCLCFVSICE